MNEAEVRKHLSEELKDLEKKVYLIVTKSEDYHLARRILLEHLLKKANLTVVYITLNTPYATIVDNLKDSSIDTSKLYFVDSISKQSGIKIKEANNCSFVKDHRVPVELSIATTDIINKKNYGFLFFDSLTTLLIYNRQETVEEFTHYLVNKIRNFAMGGIIISLEEEKSRKVANIISQFCDGFVNL